MPEKVMELRSLGYVSMGKIFAAINLVFGVIAGIFVLLWAVIASAAFATSFQSLPVVGALGPIVAGLFLAIFIPIASAITGFIYGVINALIYNVLAGIVGGIEVKFRDKTTV
jgi:hypothetical protein